MVVYRFILGLHREVNVKSPQELKYYLKVKREQLI